MSTGTCPSCSAPVSFRPGAGRVKVCEFCNTVVLKGEFKLENLGKVADLVDTESPLKLGMSGNMNGAFTVVGRIQKSNDTGTWDEWCLAFDDGRTGWLAESEGEWNLMFPVEGVQAPLPSGMKPLGTFRLRDQRFVVEEVGHATTTAAQGQLPDFNREHHYADCTGPRGVFATLDEADGHAEAFVGYEVSLPGLGFDLSELQPRPRHDALSQARCTECNGMLALKAPDATKRVACPYCGALLDVSQGKLAFLQLLEKPKFEPTIPLGKEATLAGTKWTVLAWLVRSCRVEGTRYPWEEFLLYNREKGFTWLMMAQGHWTHLTPVAAGDVEVGMRFARYDGATYKAFQQVDVTTDVVLGECYWQVSVGEQAQATEYVAPPLSINCDRTENEVTFTKGVLLDPQEVKKAFGLARVPHQMGIAPAQPNPHKDKASEAWKWTGLWAVAFVALMVVFGVMGDTRLLYEGNFSVPMGSRAGAPDAVRFSDPFEVPKKLPLEVTVEAPGLSNNWLGVTVDLVNEKTGEVIEVYAEPSYYSGTDSDGTWTEGSRSVSKQTSEVDPGTYVLRTLPTWEAARSNDYHVTVKADDTAGIGCPFCLFLFLLAIPLYSTLRSSNFETQRWNESVFQVHGVDTFPNRREDDDD